MEPSAPIPRPEQSQQHSSRSLTGIETVPLNPLQSPVPIEHPIRDLRPDQHYRIVSCEEVSQTVLPNSQSRCIDYVTLPLASSYPTTSPEHLEAILLSSPITAVDDLHEELLETDFLFPLRFIKDTLHGIYSLFGAAVGSFSGFFSRFKWLRAAGCRVMQIFVRGLEYVAGGIDVYNEICLQGFVYLRDFGEQLGNNLRFRELDGDRNV